MEHEPFLSVQPAVPRQHYSGKDSEQNSKRKPTP